ncbi:MAG: hypothetical protein ABIN01_24620 [Ferruginibacter sp.]
MSTEDFKTLFTIIASASAALFFIWKIVAGWLVVNVQISIEVERQSDTKENDLLSFKLIFIKGNTDTLQIKDVKARVRKENESDIIKGFIFPEIHKLSFDGILINFDSPNADGKNISLSPGESFHVGRFVTIPAGECVIVEAALHGSRTMWGKGFQWRASIASLPVTKKT